MLYKVILSHSNLGLFHMPWLATLSKSMRALSIISLKSSRMFALLLKRIRCGSIWFH